MMGKTGYFTPRAELNKALDIYQEACRSLSEADAARVPRFVDLFDVVFHPGSLNMGVVNSQESVDRIKAVNGPNGLTMMHVLIARAKDE